MGTSLRSLARLARVQVTSLGALTSLAALVALTSLLVPPRAQACGGFACSAAIPVVQVGEQIVYVIEEDGSLTMSVRILYNGAAPEFAWILPVPETPTISLGTETLFSTIEGSTRPSFSTSTRTDGTCRTHPTCEFPPPGPARDAGRAADASAVFFDAASFDSGGPTIFQEGSLGPYETVVLGGGTTAEIIDWLTMRGYDIPAAMAPLLDDYVAAGQRFVALRLRNDASTSDIQPITLGFGGILPCLPIRLTAIATAPTLPITAYFLAASRVASRNYSAIEPEYPTSLYFGGSYTNWVAGEATRLGGHAFATDFAGATPGIRLSERPDVSDLATESDVFAFAMRLAERGYSRFDAVLPGLLARAITPPAGVDPLVFAQCALFGDSGLGRVGDAALCGTPLSFDAPIAIAAIDEAIRQPVFAANRWLTSRPYLTRLSTTMTAEDMTIDPEFALDAGLGDHPNAHAAVQVTECTPSTFRENARVRLDTDDGRTFEVSPARASPTDAEYCRRGGGWLPGMGPAGSAGGGCAASAPRAVSRTSLAAMALIGIVVRRRRQRRSGLGLPAGYPSKRTSRLPPPPESANLPSSRTSAR